MKRAFAALLLASTLSVAAPVTQANALAWTAEDMCTMPWYQLSGWQALALMFTGRPDWC